MGTTATVKKAKIAVHTPKRKPRSGAGNVVVESIEAIPLAEDVQKLAAAGFDALDKHR